MMTFIKQNKLLTIGLTLLVLGLLYYFFLMPKSSDTPLLSTTDPTSASAETQTLLATLASLHSIRLDNALFQDPVYLSLTDFGVAIPPQSAGRNNPFAPISSAERASTATSATSATSTRIILPPTRVQTTTQVGN